MISFRWVFDEFSHCQEWRRKQGGVVCINPGVTGCLIVTENWIFILQTKRNNLNWKQKWQKLHLVHKSHMHRNKEFSALIMNWTIKAASVNSFMNSLKKSFYLFKHYFKLNYYIINYFSKNTIFKSVFQNELLIHQ